MRRRAVVLAALAALLAALVLPVGAADGPAASEVDLSARYLPGGSWFDVGDQGLAIRLTGRPAVNGIVDFRGQAGGALAFEARPLSSAQPPYGYSLIGSAVSARVTRFGAGFLLEGQAGGRPLALTLERLRDQDYQVVGRDGTKLKAWITPSLARLQGRFEPEKTSREGLAVLGAALALMFSEQPATPPRAASDAGASEAAHEPAAALNESVSAEGLDLDALFDGVKDFRGAVHVHTSLSRDSHASPEDLVKAANEIGLDFVMTSDHRGQDVYAKSLRGMQGGTLFIPGMEVIQGGSGLFGNCWPPSVCNSALYLNMSDSTTVTNPDLERLLTGPRGPEELVIVAHPLGFKDWEHGNIDGMEIYDLADEFMPPSVWGTLRRILALVLRAVGVRLFDQPTEDILIDRLQRPDAHLKKWDELLSQGRHVVGVGAPDAHQNMRIFGVQLDRYVLTLRFPSVHILARELTAQALAAALKNGRSYTSFDLLADPSGFRFSAADGQSSYTQGDSMRLARERPVVFTAMSPREGRIRLFKNGALVQEASGAQLGFTTHDPGAYRVEVELNLKGEWKPWILSNPIYLEPSPETPEQKESSRDNNASAGSQTGLSNGGPNG